MRKESRHFQHFGPITWESTATQQTEAFTTLAPHSLSALSSPPSSPPTRGFSSEPPYLATGSPGWATSSSNRTDQPPSLTLSGLCLQISRSTSSSSRVDCQAIQISKRSACHTIRCEPTQKLTDKRYIKVLIFNIRC